MKIKPRRFTASRFLGAVVALTAATAGISTAEAANRIFNLHLFNADYKAVTFTIMPGGSSCYEGTPGLGEIFENIAPGQSATITIARVQGNNCDGKNGVFGIEFDPGVGQRKTQYFAYSNNGGMWLHATTNAYPGKLSPKGSYPKNVQLTPGQARWPLNESYTYSTFARTKPVAGRPVGEWNLICQGYCNETVSKEISSSINKEKSQSSETTEAVSIALEAGLDFPGGGGAKTTMTASQEKKVGQSMSESISRGETNTKGKNVIITATDMRELGIFAAWQWTAKTTVRTGAQVEQIIVTTDKITCTANASPPSYLPGSDPDITACTGGLAEAKKAVEKAAEQKAAQLKAAQDQAAAQQAAAQQVAQQQAAQQQASQNASQQLAAQQLAIQQAGQQLAALQAATKQLAAQQQTAQQTAPAPAPAPTPAPLPTVASNQAAARGFELFWDGKKVNGPETVSFTFEQSKLSCNQNRRDGIKIECRFNGNTFYIEAQTGSIEVDFISNYSPVWNISGSATKRQVSFWRPEPADGWSRVGHSIAEGYGRPADATMVVRARGASDLLARPTDYQLIWNDAGSGAKQDGSVWRAVCPAGYSALGDVTSGSHQKPGIDEVKCVKQSALVATRLGSSIWNDAGSGAKLNFGSWRIEASAPAVTRGLFYGAPVYSSPTGIQLWAIKQ
jgi:hypothetical protein